MHTNMITYKKTLNRPKHFHQTEKQLSVELIRFIISQLII